MITSIIKSISNVKYNIAIVNSNENNILSTQEQIHIYITMQWIDIINQCIEHTYQTGHQTQVYERQRDNISADTELWLFDFANTIKLNRSMKQTQDQDMATENAQCLGLVQYYKKDASVCVHYHIFLSIDKSHDSYLALSCLDYMLQGVYIYVYIHIHMACSLRIYI
jgi:hypothetical protein